MSDVESVTIQYSSSDFDGATNRYTIELENGTTHVVEVAGNAPASTLTTAIRNTGYTGDIDDLLAMGGVQDEEGDDSYGLNDVKSVTTREVNASDSNADGGYIEYTITLDNGTVHKVQRSNGPMTASMIENLFRATGYTGDVNALIALAS